jgi:N-formylglutamate amidohydrolase
LHVRHIRPPAAAPAAPYNPHNAIIRESPMGRVLLLLLLFAVLPGLLAGRDEPLKPDEFVTVQKGTLPIIVSAPHGGKKAIPLVPERTGVGIKQFAKVRDFNTSELAEKFAVAIEKELGGKVWFVIARFDRKYLDVNRPADGAYENEKAKPVYEAYHAALSEACKAVKQKHGAGLLLDIHGQGVFEHQICRGTQNGKTVKLLKERHGWAAVTGKNSVLGRMEKAGYSVQPRCSAPEDAKEEVQFNGGYIVQTYGSHTGYGIDAIQFEFGTHFREREAYPKTATDLAEAVAAFYETYLK